MKLENGLVHYYYGMGCGKTSITTGHVIRALGHNLHPVVIQFLKKHDPSGLDGYFMGEYIIFSEKLAVPVYQFGNYGFVRTEKEKEENKVHAKAGLTKIEEVFSDEGVDLVILDEIGSMIALNLIEVGEIVSLLKNRKKHIEVIIRQMFSRIKIKEAGDTKFTANNIVESSMFINENERVEGENGILAKGEPLVLGISEVSLTTSSWLSAASFQHTTRILINASVEGRVDSLRGLKENVIIGRLIPAGTGFAGNNDNDETED